jgi:hypothetical protein
MANRDGVKKQPGRPLEDPWYRADENFRALVSPATKAVLQKSMKMHNLNQSNIVRYALFLLLKKDGLADKIDVEKDNTWKELRAAGLV